LATTEPVRRVIEVEAAVATGDVVRGVAVVNASEFIHACASHWSGVRFEVGWKIGSRLACRSSPVDTIASSSSLVTANRPCAGGAVGQRR
jgi:hypothetical protein